MPDWSVKITETSNICAGVSEKLVTAFDPVDLDAMQDDLVAWNNTTGEEHQPWMLDETGNPVPDPRKGVDPTKPISDTNPLDPRSRLVSTYMSDLILPSASSRPAFNVFKPAGAGDTWTISYGCKVHPDVETERGTIVGHAPGKGTTT
ncbi:MAG: hypothetical protein M3P06_14950 [Acidobacteriota bacterium]|nr:hypothetical protein [Acidobacteriota bacterium]